MKPHKYLEGLLNDQVISDTLKQNSFVDPVISGNETIFCFYWQIQ